MAPDETILELRDATAEDSNVLVELTMAMLEEMASRGGHVLNEED